MAVPKKRTSKTKRNMRRSHHGAVRLHLSKCTKCKQAVPPHQTCANCGTYKGKEVVDVLAKLEKKERKQKEKELREQQEAAEVTPEQQAPAADTPVEKMPDSLK